ncbi:hypothetical protein [Lichenibacterium dinghuense]|uniref:hypothetical protein n=1 Tax=Lichenibacterium dinghuense TaxID=2895977 RepID=UPI001F3DBE05|nr:hypothetical protein [Lichenibacterium sp. 6Y81]
MSFSRGWRARRAAFQHRAALAKHGSSEYREYSQRQRENERRMLQGLPPLTDEPEQQRETPEEAKARRHRDAILLLTTIEDIEAEAEAAVIIPKNELN